MASRRIAFQADALEWILSNRSTLQALRKERYAMEKGFVGYFKDFRDFIREMRGTDAKEPEKSVEKADESSGSRSLSQFYESEELTKRMKWKRITWDDDADYKSFSRRIIDNDSMFKSVSAFSFLSIYVTKDPGSTNLVNFPPQEKTVELGTLTNWVLQEREPVKVEKYVPGNAKSRRGAFVVDWVAGDVKVVDTASAQEILSFLVTVAPRLQALQIRMEEQQTKMTESIENVRVRVGALVKFNDHDTSFWDDPKRTMPTTNYVSPDDAQQFLEGLLKSAFLYRWFLKGLALRIMPPGKPYYIDTEKKEIQMPANFAEYNWLGAHTRFEKVENFINSLRALWWLWFSLGMVIVGDVELL